MTINRPTTTKNPDQRMSTTIATITMAPSKVAAGAVADRVGFTALGSGHRVRAASDDQEVHQ